MIHKVEPGHDVDEDAAVSALPACYPLHILRQLALAVQRLALFDLVDHFAHVEVDLAAVLGEAVEAVCFFEVISYVFLLLILASLRCNWALRA